MSILAVTEMERLKEHSAHEGIIVRSPETHPRFTYREMAEGARFETSDAIETIVPDLVLSIQSQSLTEESEAGEEPIKPDRAR